jgi:hypothetical protein
LAERKATKDMVSNTYQLLLKDFSFHDMEKLDQLERKKSDKDIEKPQTGGGEMM